MTPKKATVLHPEFGEWPASLLAFIILNRHHSHKLRMVQILGKVSDVPHFQYSGKYADQIPIFQLEEYSSLTNDICSFVPRDTSPPFFWYWFSLRNHFPLLHASFCDCQLRGPWPGVGLNHMPMRLLPGPLNGDYSLQGWPILRYT